MEKRRDLGKNERKTKAAEKGERRQHEAVLFNIQIMFPLPNTLLVTYM
jgi:hypothetical protein